MSRRYREDDEEILLNDLSNINTTKSPINSTQDRQGLLNLAKQHLSIVIYPIIGLALSITAFAFTCIFSRQMWTCPGWANECQVKPVVTFLIQNYAIVQGVVSTVHGIGLTTQAYSVYMLASVSLWAVFSRSSHRLCDIDNYLSAAGGSLPTLPKAIYKFRRSGGLHIFLYVLVVAILVATDATIVGFSYKRQQVPVVRVSNFPLGGGCGLSFIQRNPPAALPGPVTGGFSMYSSWSANLSSEPMQQYRQYFIDRTILDKRGNVSAKAVYIAQDIQCTGRAIPIFKESGERLILNTSLPDNNYSVVIRKQPRLTVYVDSIENKNATRSISTLIFASINGTIESGTSTKFRYQKYSSTISAVACRVDINLVDSYVEIGTVSSATKQSVLSTVETFSGPEAYRKNFGSSKPVEAGSNADIAIWLGVASTVLGMQAYGAQPMFSEDRNSKTGALFEPYTTTTSGEGFSFTISQIDEFIRICTGAMAVAMSRQWLNTPNNITTQAMDMKLNTERSYILLGPSIILWVMMIALATTVACMHRRDLIPVMYVAEVSELVAFSQTVDIADAAKKAGSSKRESVGMLKVKYGVSEDGTIALRKPDKARRFRRY